MSTSDAFSALSETPFTFSEIGCDSSAPAAPAAAGAPSILTFSARSSFDGAFDCLHAREQPGSAAAPRWPLAPLAAGAVVSDFLSLPSATRRRRGRWRRLARIIGRRIGGPSPSGWMHSLIHSAWRKEDRQQAQNQERGTRPVPWIEERASMAERGTIGKATFEQVTALVNEGMTRSAAFAKVAEETSRTPATVATAFYRVAREMPDGGGVQQRPRKRRVAGDAPAAPKRGPGRPRRRTSDGRGRAARDRPPRHRRARRRISAGLDKESARPARQRRADRPDPSLLG